MLDVWITQRFRLLPSLYRSALLRFASAGATIVLLAGCSSLGLDYARPEMRLSSAYVSTSPAGSTVTAETAWWTAFGDKQLDAFIAAGLAQNLTVLQAIERVTAARATAQINGVSFDPSVNGSASGSISGNTASNAITTSRSAAIDASWEIDLFGAGKRTREAQAANVQAAEEAVNGARLTLIGEVASAYVNIRTYQRRLALAKASLETQTATTDVVRKQVAAGRGDGTGSVAVGRPAAEHRRRHSEPRSGPAAVDQCPCRAARAAAGRYPGGLQEIRQHSSGRR